MAFLTVGRYLAGTPASARAVELPERRQATARTTRKVAVRIGDRLLASIWPRSLTVENRPAPTPWLDWLVNQQNKAAKTQPVHSLIDDPPARFSPLAEDSASIENLSAQQTAEPGRTAGADLRCRRRGRW